MKLAHYLRIVFAIGKYTDIFQGGKYFLPGVDFHRENDSRG